MPLCHRYWVHQIQVRIEKALYFDIQGYVWSAHVTIGATRAPLVWRPVNTAVYPYTADNLNDNCLLKFRICNQMHRITGNSEVLRSVSCASLFLGESNLMLQRHLRKRQSLPLEHSQSTDIPLCSQTWSVGLGFRRLEKVGILIQRNWSRWERQLRK